MGAFDRLSFERLQREFLRQHTVPERQGASGREAHEADSVSIFFEDFNVQHMAVPDPITPPSVAAHDVKVIEPVVLRALRWREVLAQELHAANMRGTRMDMKTWRVPRH
jgi:hypothetical protein